MSKQDQVLKIDPAFELHFKGPFTEVVSSMIKLHNPTDNNVRFKVKTTAPKKYCVRPNSGTVPPQGTVPVSVMLQPDFDPKESSRHKFMVQSLIVVGSPENLDDKWKEASPEQIMVSKLQCVFDMPEEHSVIKDSKCGQGDGEYYGNSKKLLPAMAAAPVAQMETLLTCSICLETLQDPRTLGCFHSFCKSCLEKFVKRQREMARAEAAAKGKDVNLEEFNCPVCRFSFCLKQGQEVEGMTPNYFVGNMLEVLAIQRQTKDIPCFLCKGPSVSRCTTCKRFLCAACLSAHENWLDFKDHVVLTMDELASLENRGEASGRSYCKKHENKSLEFYCETCQELVCVYCMDSNHLKKKHSCLLAEDVVEKEREAIKLCCGILEENLKKGNEALQEISNVAQSLENNAKKAKEDIIQQKETILKTLTQKLEEKAHLMMNEVDEKWKKVLIPIEKQKSEIQAYVEKMKGSVDLSKNVLDKGNSEEILSSKKMIEENVGRMKKECPKKMKPVHDGVIQFKVKPINYAIVVDKLGVIV